MFRTSWNTRLTDTSATDKEGVGAVRFENGKCYKWVKFDNGTDNIAAVSGNLCYYLSAGGVISGTVTSDFSSGGTGAGLFVSVPSDGQYCWIQTKGPATANQAFGGSAGGSDPLIRSSTDGLLTKGVEVDSGGGYRQVLGYVDTPGSKTLMLDCPL